MSARPDILRTISSVSSTGAPATIPGGGLDGDFARKQLNLRNLPQRMDFTMTFPGTPGSVSVVWRIYLHKSIDLSYVDQS